MTAAGVRTGSTDSGNPKYKTLYNGLATHIPDKRFVFMNHGFAELKLGAEDFSWLKREDEAWKYSINLVRHLLKAVELDGKRILDVGCGRGGTCSYLMRYAKPKLVRGLDYSDQNIEFCKSTHLHEGLDFVQGDAQHLPFEDGSFDVLTNIESSHCYPNREQFYSEVHRVLKPGGFFCYTDNLRRFPGKWRVEGQLKRAGFRVLSYEDITQNVIHGIMRSSSSLHELLTSMVDPKLGNEQTLQSIYFSVTHRNTQLYLLGLQSYRLWRLERV